jgi:hypothetical protein
MDRLAIANMRPKEARTHLRKLRGDQDATREDFERAIDNLRFNVLDAMSDAARKAALSLAIEKLTVLSREVGDLHEAVADLEERAADTTIDTAVH